MTILMHEICPYRIGSRVKINPACQFAESWPGSYAVVGIMWEYDRGDGTGINIAIADDHTIARRNGSTDGWKVEDLLPA